MTRWKTTVIYQQTNTSRSLGFRTKKKNSNNDRTIEIQAWNSYYSYGMLVSTCSNLNIIQIEKNHTKTKRNDNKRNVFFKVVVVGGKLSWNLDYRINGTGIKKQTK